MSLMWRPVAPAGIKPGQTQTLCFVQTQNLCFVNYILCSTRNVGPRFWFQYGFLLSVYALPLFLALQRGTKLYFDTGGFPAQLLALHREISTTRWLHENFVVPFLHILSPLDKALVEKPMFVQVGLICTSNLSSGTALQQNFVNRKVGWKHPTFCIQAMSRRKQSSCSK